MPKRLKHHTTRALRWSERYIKTDMVYLASGSFWLLGSQIGSAVASFFLAVAFGNLLPKEAYGIYKYFITLLSLLTVACLRGMDAVATQASARGMDGTVLKAFFAKIRWGTLGSLASAALAAYYYAHGNSTTAIALVIACFFIPIMDPLGIYTAVLMGKREFRVMSLVDAGSQMIAALCLGVALLLTHNPVVLFTLYCGVWTLLRYGALTFTLRRFPPNEKIEPHALSYGWHSSLISSAATLIASLDSLLVFHYLGAAQLAVYAFSMAPVLQLRGLVNNLTTIATPKFAGQASGAIDTRLRHRSWGLLMLGLAVAAVYSFFAPVFYHLFFPNYSEAIPYSQVFSLGIVLSLGSSLVTGVINSRITLIPKHLLYLWNIPSLIFGASSILLIARFGIWGAITGQLLSSLSGSAIAWFLWYRIRNKDFIPTRAEPGA